MVKKIGNGGWSATGRKGAERVKLLVPENDVVRLRLCLSGEVPGYGISTQRAKCEFGTLPLNLEYQTHYLRLTTPDRIPGK
ncbi:hypothetical protein LR48_Vigan07g141100 [Vigna angularis]|uniref:Uncharacterized protein n=1 Tax=Phaseolus angularis TaxID=3914 RepID=A0A0L9UYP1_PHAAN|nr:hypothetical protein LR48_Vigan07g141100 [Vigna angularis]